MITTVLFDLDGTLLPMDNHAFEKYYFGLLCKKAAPLGYQPDELIKGIWSGIEAMVRNDGSITNEDAFWQKFNEIMGVDGKADIAFFEEFYRNEFNQAKAVCGYNQALVDLVANLKKGGCRVILATNPIFPSVATESRIAWAGFTPSDFELFTTYENIGYSKPNPEYYREILRKIGADPKECVMIGNDATEDLVAEKAGLQVFLLTDHVINKNDVDYSSYPNGDAEALRLFLAEKTGLTL